MTDDKLAEAKSMAEKIEGARQRIRSAGVEGKDIVVAYKNRDNYIFRLDVPVSVMETVRLLVISALEKDLKLLEEKFSLL